MQIHEVANLEHCIKTVTDEIQLKLIFMIWIDKKGGESLTCAPRPPVSSAHRWAGQGSETEHKYFSSYHQSESLFFEKTLETNEHEFYNGKSSK